MNYQSFPADRYPSLTPTFWTMVLDVMYSLMRLCYMVQDLNWRERLALQHLKSLFSKDVSFQLNKHRLKCLDICFHIPFLVVFH